MKTYDFTTKLPLAPMKEVVEVITGYVALAPNKRPRRATRLVLECGHNITLTHIRSGYTPPGKSRCTRCRDIAAGCKACEECGEWEYLTRLGGGKHAPHTRTCSKAPRINR